MFHHETGLVVALGRVAIKPLLAQLDLLRQAYIFLSQLVSNRHLRVLLAREKARLEVDILCQVVEPACQSLLQQPVGLMEQQEDGDQRITKSTDGVENGLMEPPRAVFGTQHGVDDNKQRAEGNALEPRITAAKDDQQKGQQGQHPRENSRVRKRQ